MTSQDVLQRQEMAGLSMAILDLPDYDNVVLLGTEITAGEV